MSDQTDESTPTSPSPDASKAHGDAFLDQSGSRHGMPPARPADDEETAQERAAQEGAADEDASQA